VRRHHDAGNAVHQSRAHERRKLREGQRLPGHGRCTTHHVGDGRTQDAAVRADHDVRIQHGDQRLEVASSGCGEERVDHPALAGEVSVRGRSCPLHPAPASTRELPRRRRRAPGDRRDLVERDAEHVVQHERQPLGRRQRFEDNEQRQPDRIGQDGLVLGVDPVRATDDRVGHADVERLLAPRSPRAQHVEADPGGDRRQPATEVLNLAGVRSARPEPRLLHGVVRLAQRAEHPERHRPQVGPVLLEPLRQPLVLAHPVTLLRPAVS